MLVTKPSVVTETTFPPSKSILCRHLPIKLLMNAFVQESITGLEISVAVTLNILPVFVLKLFLFDIPLTTFPYMELPISLYNKFIKSPFGYSLLFSWISFKIEWKGLTGIFNVTPLSGSSHRYSLGGMKKADSMFTSHFCFLAKRRYSGPVNKNYPRGGIL